MQTNDLITKLSRDVKPVKRIPSLSILFLGWLIGASLCLAGGICTFGYPMDMGEYGYNSQFILESVLLFSTFFLASACAIAMGVPGTKGTEIFRRVTLIFLGSWFLLVLFRGERLIALEGMSALIQGLQGYCPLDILMMGLLPAVLLLFILRKAAPLNLEWSGIMALLAVGSLAAFGVQFTCRFDSPVHIFIYHVLPVIGLGMIGYLIEFQGMFSSITLTIIRFFNITKIVFENKLETYFLYFFSALNFMYILSFFFIHYHSIIFANFDFLWRRM
jgi:hypothetical protein